MKKIKFQTRGNYREAKGGDTDLLMSIADMLSTNFDVAIESGIVKDYDGVDYLFVSNLDRPVEAFYSAQQAKSKNIPIILYALHHPDEGMARYLRHTDPLTLKGILARIAHFDPIKYENYICGLRTIKDRLLGKKSRYQNTGHCRKYLLQNADLILVVSDKEKRTLEKDVGIHLSDKITLTFPHPIEKPSDDNINIPDSSGDYILVASRVELRKNQLRALEIAQRFPQIQFKFLGLPSKSETGYFKKVRNRIDSLENCEYLGSRDFNGFIDILKESKALLTTSLVEVTSLVELNALLHGVPVIYEYESYLSDFYFPGDTIAGSANHALNNINKGEANCGYEFRYPSKHTLTNRLVNALQALG